MSFQLVPLTISSPENILKPDSTYLFKLTADGNSNAGWLSLDWYEHTDLE